jgi:hypothetical protein
MSADSPLARSQFGGNALFYFGKLIGLKITLNSTRTVENAGDLSGLTGYKDFFIWRQDDQFAHHHARSGRPDPASNRISRASA